MLKSLIQITLCIGLVLGLAACGARNAPTYSYGEGETPFRYAPLYE